MDHVVKNNLTKKIYFYNPDVLSWQTMVNWTAKEGKSLKCLHRGVIFNLKTRGVVKTLSCKEKDKIKC